MIATSIVTCAVLGQLPSTFTFELRHIDKGVLLFPEIVYILCDIQEGFFPRRSRVSTTRLTFQIEHYTGSWKAAYTLLWDQLNQAQIEIQTCTRG